MSFVPSEETLARPRHTIHAAESFHVHARDIARSCALIGHDEVVLAEVDRFLSFSGVWSMYRSQLAARSSEFDHDGWTMVFSPGTDMQGVEARAVELARHAFQRWEALRRWSSKHRE